MEKPPRPRLAISVGVIGHRPNRLPEAARDQVVADVGFVLDGLIDEAKRVIRDSAEFFSPTEPLFSVISALAEGADRIAAEAALERGWELDVVLPFSAEVYEVDFKEADSVSTFNSLLSRARSTLVLPGERTKDLYGYEAAGLTVLDQSDVLLTIWDGGPSEGRGGTTRMLEAASRLDIPIVHIDARGEAPPRILWAKLAAFPVPVATIEGLPAQTLSGGLKELVDKLTPPPSFANERGSLKSYFEESFHRYNLRLEFPLLMAMCGVRTLGKQELQPPDPQALATGLLTLSAFPTGQSYGASVLASAYGWADAVAIRYAQIFRGAFVMNFLLASIAVVVAVSSLFDHDRKYLFVVVELLLIAFVLTNTFIGRRRAWHRRWFESREVAERLRIALAFWALGARPRGFSGEQPTWTGWYARAIVREQRPLSAALDFNGLATARAMLVALLNEQCRYHRSTAERMERLEQRLEVIGLILFAATILTAVAYLFAAPFMRVTEPAALLVTALAAGLPSLATASYGIRVIGDLEGIARRSKRTDHALEQLVGAVRADPLTLEHLRTRARTAADAMLGDVASWRIAAESRGLNIPG
jgi:hypothetical protein